MHVLQANSWTWLVQIHAVLICVIQQPEDVLLKNTIKVVRTYFAVSGWNMLKAFAGHQHSGSTRAAASNL